jgi:hypothetical protein
MVIKLGQHLCHGGALKPVKHVHNLTLALA